MHKTLAVLTRDDIRSLEIAINKVTCAQQSLRPDAVPSYAPRAAADTFFREAIFAYADARYLQKLFWRDLTAQYCLDPKDLEKIYVDFETNELYVME